MSFVAKDGPKLASQAALHQKIDEFSVFEGPVQPEIVIMFPSDVIKNLKADYMKNFLKTKRI